MVIAHNDGKKIKFNIPYFDKDHLKNHNFLYKNQKFSGNNVFSKSVKKFYPKNITLKMYY